MNKYTLSGQVGLLLLVIMGVVVALVMSVASRSLSDTVLSRQERESSAAFAIAETGVESAMIALREAGDAQIGGSLSDVSGLVTGTYQVSNLSTYSLFLREGETGHLDLTGLASPNVLISWTKRGDESEEISCGEEGSGGSSAAIEVSVINSGTDSITREYFNPANCTLLPNGFASSDSLGGEYLSSVNYGVPVGASELRIKPLYAGATVTASGSGLDTQLYKIDSRASGGDAQKEIEVKRGLDSPSSIFDFAVFTGGTIIK